MSKFHCLAINIEDCRYLKGVATRVGITMWERSSPPEMTVTPVPVNLTDVSTAPIRPAVSS